MKNLLDCVRLQLDHNTLHDCNHNALQPWFHNASCAWDFSHRKASFSYCYGFWKWYYWEANQTFWVQKRSNHSLLIQYMYVVTLLYISSWWHYVQKLEHASNLWWLWTTWIKCPVLKVPVGCFFAWFTTKSMAQSMLSMTPLAFPPAATVTTIPRKRIHNQERCKLRSEAKIPEAILK